MPERYRLLLVGPLQTCCRSWKPFSAVCNSKYVTVKETLMGSSAQPESKTKGNAVEGMLAKQEFEEAVELSPVQVVEQHISTTFQRSWL